MILHVFNEDELVQLIESELLSNSELNLIYKKLKDLYEIEDEFDAYWDSLSPAEKREAEEIDGIFINSLYPFRPFFVLDKQKHKKLITYLQLADIGINVRGEFDPYKNDTLRQDVIDLKEMK